MKSVLFVARIDPEAPAVLDWANFSGSKREDNAKHRCIAASRKCLVAKFGEVCVCPWLADLFRGRELINLWDLPFEKEPQWLPAGFYPGTTPDQTPNS